MNDECIRAAAREAIREVSQLHIADDECIISTGIIDSLSIVKLLACLEKKLKIRIPAAKVQPEDFDSVNVILETVKRIVP